MEKTAEAYKKTIADRNKPKVIKDAEKDTKFMRGLQKLDSSRVKGEKLMDMSQFLIKQARSSGRRYMTKVGRGLRRASYAYLKNINSKAKAMIQRKHSKRGLN